MQTFTMARWQIVVKTSEATKQTKDQNDNKNQTNKTTTKRAEGAGVEKQITKRIKHVSRRVVSADVLAGTEIPGDWRGPRSQETGCEGGRWRRTIPNNTISPPQ